MPWFGWLSLTVVVVVLLVGVLTEPGDAPEPGQSGEASSSDVPTGALDQMAIAFEGSHSRSEIAGRMDRAMGLYGTSLTEDNYARAGSTLVALRQEYGVDEMDILGHMICSHVPGVDFSFPDMAAISTVAYTNGDRCR